MGKLISFAVRNLVEESWWNRTVENQVASVQQNLLHGLPPLDTSSSTLLRWRIIIPEGFARSRVCMLQHWSLVVIFETRLEARFQTCFRSWREGVRFVRLVVVPIVVRFGVDSVFLEGCMLFERMAAKVIRRVLATR